MNESKNGKREGLWITECNEISSDNYRWHDGSKWKAGDLHGRKSHSSYIETIQTRTYITKNKPRIGTTEIYKCFHFKNKFYGEILVWSIKEKL